MKPNLPSPPVHRRWTAPGLIALFVLMSFQVSIAQTELVKDINLSAVSVNEFVASTDFNGSLYLAADKGLWKTDGTQEGLELLKQFKVLHTFKTYTNVLFFLADDGVHGLEIWKTDGTSEGTVLLKDITSGTGVNIVPGSFTVANDLLFFVATNDANGTELWRTDGTTAGTFVVRDIINGPKPSNPTELVAYQNKLFFVASDGLAGYELWTSDGSTAGTNLFFDIIPGKTSSGPGLLTVSNSTLFFYASTTTEGRELWKTDGTTGGTVLVKDIRPGALNSSPRHMMDVNGTLYFAANDDVHGVEFWKSDGTTVGTQLAFELNIGSGSGITNWTHDVAQLNGKIYISVTNFIYESDGTQAGTRNFTHSYNYYNGVKFVPHNNALYYIDFYEDGYEETIYHHTITRIQNSAFSTLFAGEGSLEQTQLMPTSFGLLFPYGTEDRKVRLWKTNGTQAGTAPFLDVVDFTAGSRPGSFGGFVPFDGAVIFPANDQLWRSDGTTAGTQMLTPLARSNNALTPSGPRVYFAGEDGNLWKTNGTVEGTMLVRKVNARPFVYSTRADFNGTLFFAGGPAGSKELWKSTGNFAGTVQVKDIYPGATGSNPQHIHVFNGTLYFAADHPTLGRVLWKSDGTDPGTVPLIPADPAHNFTNPRRMLHTNNLLYFVADHPVTGVEIYRTDGTPAGTTLFKDMRTGDNTFNDYFNDDVRLDYADGNRLYFGAINDGKWVIFATDGTAANTVQLLPAQSPIGGVGVLGKLNNKVILSGFVLADKSAMWSTEGTPETTELIRQFNRSLSAATIMDNVMYFQGPGGLWRTEGTACSTFEVPSGGHQLSMVAGPYIVSLKNRMVLFAASDPYVGDELFKLDKAKAPSSECHETVATARQSEPAVESVEELSQNIICSPNPFVHNFNLRVNSPEEKFFAASIITLDGKEVSTLNELKTNTDYPVGSSLERGVYLVKVVVDNRIEVRRVVKVN